MSTKNVTEARSTNRLPGKMPSKKARSFKKQSIESQSIESQLDMPQTEAKRIERDLLNKIRSLSLRIKEAQKPLRILSTVRWDPEFQAKFLSQPKAPTRDSLAFNYSKTPLRFTPREKLNELAGLRREIADTLREVPGVAHILTNIVLDYEKVTHLIAGRGQETFGKYSQRLWGSPSDTVLSDGTTIRQFTQRFKNSLERLSDDETEKLFPKVLTAEAMVALLKRRLNEVHLLEQVDVSISDQLVSDAAAGGNYIKIRKGAMFSIKDVDVFVFHEAFTHIATSLNGRHQPHALWLSFDSPRCTSTQEGLAVLMEMLSGRTYPARMRRIIDRILILSSIEEGQGPTEIYDSLRTDGYGHREALTMIMRAYRGSSPDTHQPFTKDVSYMKGLIECWNFVQTSLIDSRHDDIHALYAGKLTLSEVPILVEGFKSGIVGRPKWIPSVFLDLDSLSGWFTYVSALGNMTDIGMRSRFRNERNAVENLKFGPKR